MTTYNISHAGVIESITKDCIHVKIVQSSACASCKIASHCTSAESKEKIVDVYVQNTTYYSVGENVDVVAATRTGFRAVMYCFVIPTLLIILAIVSALYIFKCSEPVSALIGLVILMPYYTLLYICRNYFKRTITFEIKR